jgi:hypothetical protein
MHISPLFSFSYLTDFPINVTNGKLSCCLFVFEPITLPVLTILLYPVFNHVQPVPTATPSLSPSSSPTKEPSSSPTENPSFSPTKNVSRQDHTYEAEHLAFLFQLNILLYPISLTPNYCYPSVFTNETAHGQSNPSMW